MPVQITCQQCGTTVSIPPSKATRRKFCSHKCRASWMSENLVGEKAPRWGKAHTPETQAKIAATKRANPRMGEKAANWKGGKYRSRGYVYVKLTSLPEVEQEKFVSMATARKGGQDITTHYIPEHRLVMARVLDRPLTSAEHVHHINGVKSDNRPANLEVTSNSAHRQKHSDIEAEMYRLRAENEVLREALSKFCDVSALLNGGTTST